MACNRLFGEGAGDLIAPTNENSYFSISRVDLKVFNREIFNLIIDFQQLYGLVQQLGETHVAYQAMFVANQMVTFSELGEYTKARELATEFFSQTSAGEKAHTLYALGHCHIGEFTWF
jgi:alpha-mannosidase